MQKVNVEILIDVFLSEIINNKVDIWGRINSVIYRDDDVWNLMLKKMGEQINNQKEWEEFENFVKDINNWHEYLSFNEDEIKVEQAEKTLDGIIIPLNIAFSIDVPKLYTLYKKKTVIVNLQSILKNATVEQMLDILNYCDKIGARAKK